MWIHYADLCVKNFIGNGIVVRTGMLFTNDENKYECRTFSYRSSNAARTGKTKSITV